MGEFSDVIHKALWTPRHPIKKVVAIAPVWERDGRGRFVKLVRRKHFRRLRDKARLVTGMQQMMENIKSNNALLLSRLTGRK